MKSLEPVKVMHIPPAFFNVGVDRGGEAGHPDSMISSRTNIWLPLACVLASATGLKSQVAAASAPGFFRVEQRDGRWWFVDPSGQLFLSKGVCHILWNADSVQDTRRSPYGETTRAKYGSVEQWRESAGRRLVDYGFNSLGAWSDENLARLEFNGRRLANAPILNLGADFVAANGQGDRAWLKGIFPDVFDPRFEAFCRRAAQQRCEPRKNDTHLLGWFIDNELRWGPDWRGSDELLTLFLNLPADAPGRHAAVDLLRERHGEISKFNSVWRTRIGSWLDLEKAGPITAPFTRKALYAQNEGEELKANEADPLRASFVADCEAFVGRLAECYFRVTRDALHAADPNHLNFGCRFAYVPPAPVLAAAKGCLDVVSFNCYSTDPKPVVRKYASLGKPLVIGEFTFRARDSGLPNTKGAGPVVQTQTERADAFERYVRAVLEEPEIVGYHWFQHSDQPKEGRFDGENSNYGVVNTEDQPYAELTKRMIEVNRQAEQWHRAKN